MKRADDTEICLRSGYNVSSPTRCSIRDTIKMRPVMELDESMQLFSEGFGKHRGVIRRDIFNLTVNQGQYERLNRKQP